MITEAFERIPVQISALIGIAMLLKGCVPMVAPRSQSGADAQSANPSVQIV